MWHRGPQTTWRRRPRPRLSRPGRPGDFQDLGKVVIEQEAGVARLFGRGGEAGKVVVDPAGIERRELRLVEGARHTEQSGEAGALRPETRQDRRRRVDPRRAD